MKARVGRSGGYGVSGFITDAEDAAGGWLDMVKLEAVCGVVLVWWFTLGSCFDVFGTRCAPGPTARGSPHQKPTLS